MATDNTRCTNPDDTKARNSDLLLSIRTYPGSKGPPSDKKQVNSSGPSVRVDVAIFNEVTQKCLP